MHPYRELPPPEPSTGKAWGVTTWRKKYISFRKTLQAWGVDLPDAWEELKELRQYRRRLSWWEEEKRIWKAENDTLQKARPFPPRPPYPSRKIRE